jgi:hypothetical protein
VSACGLVGGSTGAEPMTCSAILSSCSSHVQDNVSNCWRWLSTVTDRFQVQIAARSSSTSTARFHHGHERSTSRQRQDARRDFITEAEHVSIETTCIVLIRQIGRNPPCCGTSCRAVHHIAGYKLRSTTMQTLTRGREKRQGEPMILLASSSLY